MYQKILFILFPLSLNAINIGSIEYAYVSGATPYQYLNYSLSFNKESSDGYSTNTMTGNNFDNEYVDFLIHTPSNNYYHFGAPRVVGFRVSKNF